MITEPPAEIELFTNKNIKALYYQKLFRQMNNLDDNWNYSGYGKDETFKIIENQKKFLAENGALWYGDDIDIVKCDCVDVVGCFKVEYTRLSNGIFGDQAKFDESTTNAKFYQNDVLLFEKSVSGNTLILYGDGQTLEKTYYCTRSDHYHIGIYNLKNELIYTTSVGWDCQKELRKINNKYMISNTSEPCTHSLSLGLLDMEVFFNPDAHNEKTAFYNNARIGFTTDYGIVPVKATPNGFVIKHCDDWTKEYPILPYENVKEFNFEPKSNQQFWDEINQSLTMLNPNLKVSDNLKSYVKHASNTFTEGICIPIELLQPQAQLEQTEQTEQLVQTCKNTI